MSLIQAFVLGLFQGLTEFIPVSSSGHLVLVPWLFGWSSPNPDLALAFDTVLHLGTLVAIIGVFWRELVALAVGFVDSIRQRSLAVPQGRLAWMLIIATIPAAVMGVALKDLFESLFSSPAAAAALLVVTGVLLAASERYAGVRATAPAAQPATETVSGDAQTGGGAREQADQLGTGQALFVGVAQGIAIAPGISRSGATIAAGRFLGLTRTEAARFSFLLAIPTIAGAGALQLRHLAGAGALLPYGGPLLLGFLAALVSGYLIIRFLLSYLRQHSLLPFALYCWVVGLAALAVWLVR